MPVLSIVIPAYNMAEWLPAALESCLWQSHKDLDILVVDDGSADAGPEIAAAYARLDSRIRLITQANAGVGAARQRGQDEASGDYITWMDADDFLAPDAAQNWLGAAEQDTADLVCGNAIAFSSRTFNARRYFPHPPATGLRFDDAPRYWKSKVLWRWALSLPFVRRAGLRHPPFKLGQDVCFMTEALLRAERFAQVAPCVYYFRQEHKPSAPSLETQVEHGFKHFITMRRILLHPPDGRPRIGPLVKYLTENYWRDIRRNAPRLVGQAAREGRVLALGLELFKEIEPDWFRSEKQAALPGPQGQPSFLSLVEALSAGDAEAARNIIRSLQQRPEPTPDKRSPFHTARHLLKSALNPLSWSARARLRRLEALAAKRKGIPKAVPGQARHSGR